MHRCQPIRIEVRVLRAVAYTSSWHRAAAARIACACGSAFTSNLLAVASNLDFSLHTVEDAALQMPH